MKEPQFPYQSYLDSIREDFPTIGADGGGFNAISHNIRYPEMPDTLRLSPIADTLMQIYNVTLAFNTMAYDVGTAERYLDEFDFVLEQADSLDSINLKGITIAPIRDGICQAAHMASEYIRKGIRPNSQSNVGVVENIYKAHHKYSDSFIMNHLDDSEFDPSTVLDNYNAIHSKAITDTTTYRQEILQMVLREKNFSKRCVLAREFAYANYHSPHRDDKELVAVLDEILRENNYSPLLGELWRMWRVTLQINLFGSRSNDGAMYNLFYNDMRNRVALVYIAHLKIHPHDKIAFKEFFRLAQAYNIVRNSQFSFGNNANLEEMELFYSVFNPNQSDDESE